MNKAVFDVVERVLSTAVQAAVGVAAGMATTVVDGSIDWRSALVTVGVAAGMSVLKNLQVLVQSSSLPADEKALAAQVEAAVQARLSGLSPVKSVELPAQK